MSLLSRESRVVAAKVFALLLFMYIVMHSVPIALSLVSFLGFIIIPFMVFIHRITVQTILPVAVVYGFFYDIYNDIYFGVGFLIVLGLFFTYNHTRQLYSSSSYVFSLLNTLSIVVAYNVVTALLVFPLSSDYILGVLFHIVADYVVIIFLRLLIFRRV